MNTTPTAVDPLASLSYGLHGHLPKPDVAQALAWVTEAQKTQVFGIWTEIGVPATMKAMPVRITGPP